MSLGVCCQWLEPRKKRDGSTVYENSINEKSLQLGCFKDGKYSRERIINTYRNNVSEHIKFFPKLLEANIKSFRLSSSLFPLYEFNRESVVQDTILLNLLSQLGKMFIDADIRVTTHPGQFCIINSDSEHVIQNSIRELEYHAFIFDQMGLSTTQHNAINIHGGKRGNVKKLIDVINSLPANIRNRLTLENDERCFSVKQLLEISANTAVPIVFDSHHHQFNLDGFDTYDACYAAIGTWTALKNDLKPLQHLSNTEPGNEFGSFTEKRKHSNYIHNVPVCQLNLIKNNAIDLDVEAKMKNLAILKLRQDFDIFN